ncbi:MAG: PAS domain S-box protein, partial [Desulfuromonadales bacterium]
MVTRNERELYEASNSIIVRWDNEGIIRYINKVGLRFFGYSSEELIGQKVGCLIPNLEESTGRDLSSLVKNILEIPAEHVVFENENVTKEGKTVWIAWTNQAILNEQGEIIEILAIGNCISALKESEENLAKEKALLRTVIDSAEDLIYFKDRNSTYIGCNKVSEAFTGLAESEQIGKSDFDFFGQAQAEAIVKDDQNILENRTAVHTEDWVTSPVSGEQRVLDTVKAPILGPDGQAIGLVGISRDITERKKAEREITEANNFNQIIIENSPVGILVFKESGQCVQANPAAEIIVGASHEQMLKLNFREMETYKKTEILADMEEVFRTGVSIKKEIRTTNTFGKEVWFEGVISTFRKNEENYILYIFTDIIQIKKALEALQKSEERHRTIFQTAMDGIWFVDKKGCFLEVNESYCLMSGYSKQELLTMCISDVENIESPEDTIAHLEKLKDLGNVRFLSQHRRKDGRLFDVEVTAQTHNEDDIYYVAFLRDITELKKKELELKNSEEKTRLILDSAAEAIYGLDPFGNCTFCNQSCLNILGYRSDEELLGRNMHEVIHHSTVEGLPNPAGECQIFESFQHGEKVHIKNDHLWKADGTSFTAEVWSHPIRKDDAVIGAVVTFNDITKQKQSEEKLEQSHNLLSKLARLVPGVIYQYRLFPDGSSAFPYSSPGMNDIYEVSPEEVQEDATPAFGRLHPDDYDMVANLIQVSAQTLKTFYCEFRVILPRQGLRWRWSQAHPERLDDGSTLWHGLISDITERKQSEYEKEQLQIQLSQAQKIESIGQLAGGVAHDFNNILGVILGHTELALRKLDPASPLISDLEENRKAANRAAELTRQLLTFARKQAITPKV